MHFLRKADSGPKVAEANARTLVAKLKRGGYMNAAHEAAEKRMLSIYLAERSNGNSQQAR